MDANSRIALVAVRMGPGAVTAEPQAIVVGTMPAGVQDWTEGDWRYVCYPLRALLSMLESGEEDPLAPKADGAEGRNATWASPADAVQAARIGGDGRFHPDERKALEGLELKDAFLDKKLTIPTSATTSAQVRRLHTAFPLRGIEQVFFFSQNTGLSSLKLTAPFAALDTARTVDPTAADDGPLAFEKIEPAGNDPGSRVVLFQDFSDPKRPGLLAALAIHLEIKVAVNGHQVGNNDPLDPRMLLNAAVVRGAAPLWSADPVRGALFDVVKLSCTLGAALDARAIGRRAEKCDLLELALDKDLRARMTFTVNPQQVTDCGALLNPGQSFRYLVDALPATAALGLPSVGNDRMADRTFGFRLLAGTEAQPAKMGWRFELAVVRYVDELGQHVLRRLIPKWPPRDIDLGDHVKVSFEEEQRVAGVAWRPSATSARTSLTVRLLDKVGDAQKELEKDLTRHVIDASNDLVLQVQTGLKRVRDGRPVSLLPELLASGTRVPWHATGYLVDSAPGRRLSGPESTRSGALVTFEPCRVDDLFSLAPAAVSLTGKANLRCLVTAEREAPQYVAVLKAPTKNGVSALEAPAFQPLASVDESGVLRGTLFSLELKTWSLPLPIPADEGSLARQRRVLLGALELTLAREFQTDVPFDRIGQISLLPLPADPRDHHPGQLETAIDAVIVIAVDRADPGGQDDSERDVMIGAQQRGNGLLADTAPDPFAPLLLPISGSGVAAPGEKTTIKLEAREVVTRDRDHSLALSLRSVETRGATNVAAAPQGRVLVIDPRPFRIAAIDYQSISAAATSESNEVAVWNAEGEGGLSWRVRDDGQSVGLELPPQVLGDAMEKNRSGGLSLPPDVEPGKPSAVRFGSTTRMRIDPTFADTRFREPGWNLRRILGNALQRQPGARLLDLRLELLYGLLTRIRAEGLFVTELAGAIGEPALPLFDTLERSQPHLDDHRKLIRDVLEAERFRLAVDKPYRLRPDELLRIEEGVSFKLRLREPDENGVLRGPKTPLRWPVPGGIPEDTGGLVKREVLERAFSASGHDEDSFPGGLAWAFESANILMSVYGRPQSDGGSVGGLYLSAHGGYGGQRALFDERKSVVETETTQGRVQRYRLERVGRIACLWHPAKHVIVYERTVVPSGQFYNAQPIGLRQDEHAGRALPRKVEEYVEILKPKREYPEDGTSIRASGCLVGAEFKSIKIRVDSSWGSDVRREGWQVPLWNTDFEGLKPDPNNPDHPANLFPKPQVRLTFAGKDGDVAKEVDEPAKLVFYTSVVPGEDDRTDLWKPVRDVDFCDAPKISPGKVQTASDDLTDAMLPPEPEHVPGYEKLTLGLVASKDAVAVAHGRVADGPSAPLRNVTIARAVALPTGPQAQAVPEFGRALGAKVADVRAELDRQVGRVVGALEKLDRDTDPDHLEAEAQRLIEQAIVRLKAEIPSLPKLPDELKDLGGFGDPCKGLGERARATVEGQLTRFQAVAKALLAEAAKSITERLNAAAGVVEADIGVVDAMAGEAERLAVQLGRDGLLDDEKRRLLDQARRIPVAAAARIEDLREKAKDRIRARIAAIEKDLKTLPESLRSDLVALRDRTRADLSLVRDALGSTLEGEGDELRESLDLLGAAIDDCVAKLQEGVDQGLGITAQAQAAARTMGDKVGEARAQLRPLIDRLAAAKAPDAVQVLLQNVVIALDRVSILALAVANADRAAPARDLLEAVKRVRDAAIAAKDALKKGVRAVFTVGLDVLARIEAELDAILDQTVDRVDELIELVKVATDRIVAKLEQARQDCEAKLNVAAAQLTALVEAIGQAIPAPGSIAIPPALIAALRKLGLDGANLARDLRRELGAAASEVESLRLALAARLEAIARDLTSFYVAQTELIGREAQALIDELQKKCGQLFAFLADLAAGAKKRIEDEIKKALGLDDYPADLERQLKQAVADVVKEGRKTIVEVKTAVAAEAARVNREAEARVRQIAGTIQQSIENAAGAGLSEIARRAEGVYQKGDNALRLIRAVGDPPKTDSLGFNRPEVAYVFGEAKELGIDMTPTLALVNRAADQVAAVDQAGKAVGELLDSFGVRLPVTQLADQLIPDKLKSLSVSDLVPDMGGIDFKGLLQRVGFPDLDDSNAVKVRHGFDKATRRAWMEGDIEVPFAEAVPLMSFGPVQILIDTAKFESHARLSAGAGGGIERKMNGRIFGDWRVVSGGQTILTFRKTGLTFDDSGQIDFRIQPDRVELAEALRFITDLMRATGQKGGLRIEPLMRGGIPSGVAATLDMVLPPIQTGAFGVSDLSLHVLFGIAAFPRFEILSELAVGSRLTPFSLSVWILNGGGYLIQQLTYAPTAKPKPLLTYTLDIALVAGVGLGFSCGIVSGGVYLHVGCGIALTWTTGAGGNTTTMRVFLLARGNVDVAGIVTASIALLFEVSYDGERMIGAGTLTLRIKISEFYKLSVDEHVEYVFAGQKKQEQVGESSSEAFC